MFVGCITALLLFHLCCASSVNNCFSMGTLPANLHGYPDSSRCICRPPFSGVTCAHTLRCMAGRPVQVNCSTIAADAHPDIWLVRDRCSAVHLEDRHFFDSDHAIQILAACRCYAGYVGARCDMRLERQIPSSFVSQRLLSPPATDYDDNDDDRNHEEDQSSQQRQSNSDASTLLEAMGHGILAFLVLAGPALCPLLACLCWTCRPQCLRAQQHALLVVSVDAGQPLANDLLPPPPTSFSAPPPYSEQDPLKTTAPSRTVFS